MRKYWSRYDTTGITRHEARTILRKLAKRFRVKRPRLIFVPMLFPRHTLADYTPPENGHTLIRIKENTRHNITTQTLCHEFAHHVEYLERGVSNHGDYFRNALHRIYNELEKIKI